jgi:hypothetical protein
MDDLSVRMRSAEYVALRDELQQNKQYVFERPLIIITAAGVASVQLSGEPSVVLLPLLLVVLLLVNLWFTVNRLRSLARIAAYIAVVLEPLTDDKWIGWERSLRIYRKWMKTHSLEERTKILESHIESSAIPDAMMFYPAIYWLHIATVVIALAVSGLLVVQSPGILEIVSLSITLLAGLVFAGYCIGPHHPSKMRDLIEVQRAIWIVVLGKEDAV